MLSWLELLRTQVAALIDSLGEEDLLTRLFPQNERFASLSLLSRYFRDIVLAVLHYLVPPVQNFATRTWHAATTKPKHSLFLCVTNLRRNIQSVLSQEQPIYGGGSCVSASLNSTILTSPSQGSRLTFYYILFHSYYTQFMITISKINHDYVVSKSFIELILV